MDTVCLIELEVPATVPVWFTVTNESTITLPLLKKYRFHIYGDEKGKIFKTQDNLTSLVYDRFRQFNCKNKRDKTLNALLKIPLLNNLIFKTYERNSMKS